MIEWKSYQIKSIILCSVLLRYKLVQHPIQWISLKEVSFFLFRREVQNICDYRLHHVFWWKGNQFLFCLALNATLLCSVKLLCFDRSVCHQGHISMSALRLWTWPGNETGIPKQCQVQWGALWTSRRFLFILRLSSALLRLFISGISPPSSLWVLSACFCSLPLLVSLVVHSAGWEWCSSVF